MLKNPVSFLRHVAIAEGVSLLALFLIAMPIKYLGGVATAVKYTGWVHGLLFLLLCVALLLAIAAARLSVKFSALVFIASLVPFGFLFVDRRLKEEAARLEAGQE